MLLIFSFSTSGNTLTNLKTLISFIKMRLNLNTILFVWKILNILIFFDTSYLNSIGYLNCCYHIVIRGNVINLSIYISVFTLSIYVFSCTEYVLLKDATTALNWITTLFACSLLFNPPCKAGSSIP